MDSLRNTANQLHPTHPHYQSDEDSERAGFLAEVHSHGRAHDSKGSLTQRALDSVPDAGIMLLGLSSLV